MTSDATPRRSALDAGDALGLAFLVALFAGTRLLWLATTPETATYWEELYRWAAMRELLAGPVQPLLDYQADHYQGGSLLMIVLGVPLVGIVGESVVGFKAVALVFSIATLILLYAIGRLFFGRSVALLAGLAYVAGPALVAFWGLVVMGFHPESTLFVLAQMFLLLGLLGRRWRHARGWAALGMACGLGVWFSYTAGIGVLACALTWLLLEGLPRRRELLALGGGALLGFSPWLAYNLTNEFAGVTRGLELLGLHPVADAWPEVGAGQKAGQLLLRDLPTALVDPTGEALTPPLRRLLLAGLALPLSLALGAGVRRAVLALRERRLPDAADETSARRLELVFHVYAALFVAAYLGSRFAPDTSRGIIGYRLLAPLAIVAILPAVISLARGLRTPGPMRRFSVSAGGLCLISLGASTLAVAMRPAENVEISAQRGHEVRGILLHRKHAPELAPAVEAALRIREPASRERALVGIGWGIQDRFERVGSPEELARALEEVPPDALADVLRGVTWFAAHRASLLEKQQTARGRLFTEQRALQRTQALERLASDMSRGRGGATGPPLLLVTLDTTRADHLSAYGYERPTSPTLDALVRRAVRYERVWSTSSWTLPAHASLFTGLYPATHGAHFDAGGDAVLGSRLPMPIAGYVRAGALAERWTTLAELLAARGYRSAAFVGGPWLHRSFGLLQGFETLDDEVTSFDGRPAAELTDRAIAWLRGLEPAQPWFLFVNYFDPHAPYRPPPGFDDLPRARDPEPELEALISGKRSLTPVERETLVDRYDGEIRSMDHQLGRLLEAVEAHSGDAALIVVTADHGEAFGEGGRIGHTFWLSQELLWVPLIVRYPGRRGAGSVDASPLSLVDVLPLLAGELGLELAEEVQGLAPGARQTAFAELYREATAALRFGERFDRDLGAALLWPHKLVRSSREERWLARLRSGSAEEVPLRDAALADRLADLLDAHEGGVERSAVVPAPVDPRTLEALRRLGYVE